MEPKYRNLLIRIDERVKALPEIKKDIKEIREHTIKNHYRIKALEKYSISFNIFSWIGRILR